MEYVKAIYPASSSTAANSDLKVSALKALKTAPSPTEKSDMVIIQEWPGRESFYAWWNSEEYKPWKEMRPQGANVTVTLAEQRGNNF
jgi:uncharacterized protein (DUF1330 family)